MGKACLDAGADGLSAINTVLGMAIDVESRRPVLSRGVGGLSGPAIRPIALAKCWELLRALNCDVIGIGGIANTGDMLQFLVAGCKAIQVGTAVYINPSLPGKMATELEQWMIQKDVSSLKDLVGSIRVNEALMLGPARSESTEMD